MKSCTSCVKLCGDFHLVYLQVFSILDTQIKTVNSAGLCFDAWGQSMQPGDRISLYSCWNGDNQQWQPSQQDRQIYLNNASGLCLAGTPSATGLTAEVCNNSSNTRWYIQSVTEGVTLANGTASRYVDNTPEEYLIRAQYYAFKQFTAFVQPNDVILGSTDTSNTTLLAQKPDGRVVVVLVNTATDASQSWTIQLNQAAGQAAEVYLSDDTHDCERMSDVAVGSDGKLEVTLGSSSIATYVVRSNSFS
jgi:O-glycosyl hydrolase